MPAVLSKGCSLLASCAIALVVLGAAGCQQAAGLYANASDPPAIEPQYVPQKVATLVLAEHAPGALADDAACEAIGRDVAGQWEQHALSPLVHVGAVEALRGRLGDSKFRAMSISEVGKTVGAKQVLYVDVVHTDTEVTGDMLRGKVAVRVKMINSINGQTLWPTDSAGGFPLETTSEYVEKGDGVTEATVREATSHEVAGDLVRLFYKYKPDK